MALPPKIGPFANGVFGQSYPLLGEEVWREGIEVFGRAEGVVIRPSAKGASLTEIRG